MLLDTRRKKHKEYLVVSRAERHEEKVKFVSIHTNQINFRDYFMNWIDTLLYPHNQPIAKSLKGWSGYKMKLPLYST